MTDKSSDDIVETASPAGLRERAKIQREILDESCARHLELAADEIERLRAAASQEWNDGCDFAMTQLCKFLDVEPSSVSWDAATETVDGDVQAVICNILRAKFGEDWAP